MGLTQIYSILTQKKAAQTVRAPLPRALINPQHSPASFNHKLAVIAALKTSPCSSCLKKLCLCHFIHQSVGRWSGDSCHRDGTGTSPVWCPGNSRCCWHWGWKAQCFILLWISWNQVWSAEGTVQCIILFWASWNQVWRAASKISDCCFRGGSVRVRGCSMVGKQRRLEKVRQQPALPPWMKQPPQGGAEPSVSTWTRRKCCFGAAHQPMWCFSLPVQLPLLSGPIQMCEQWLLPCAHITVQLWVILHLVVQWLLRTFFYMQEPWLLGACTISRVRHLLIQRVPQTLCKTRVKKYRKTVLV